MAALPKLSRPEPRRNSPEDPEEFRLTLSEHLEELRDRIVRIVVFLATGCVIGWFVERSLYEHLTRMVNDSIKPVLPAGTRYEDVFRNMPDAFMLKLKLSFQIGIGLSLPLIVGELWGFVAPGLTPAERRPVRRIVPFSALLFITGATFCWFVLPATLRFFVEFLGEFPGVSLYQEAGMMVFFIIKMMIAFGIAFQLPVIVFGLGALNLLSAETLIKHWRQAGVVIFIASALITPSGDAFTMSVMALPLIILFIISVYLVKYTQKRRKTDEDDPEYDYSPAEPELRLDQMDDESQVGDSRRRGACRT